MKHILWIKYTVFNDEATYRANGLRLHLSCISHMAINVRVVAFDNLTSFGYIDCTLLNGRKTVP